MLELLVNLFTRVLAYSIVGAFVSWLYFQWNKWDFLVAARRLPSPTILRALPILGHSYVILGGWEGYTKQILLFTMAAVSEGLYNICVWCGPLPIIMIHKLEDVQKILYTSATAEKEFDYKYLDGIYAGKNGLLTAPGHVWKETRRHINPLFHPRNVEQLMTVFNNNSRELVLELAEHVDAGAVDVTELTKSVTLKTVCQLIFGSDVDFDRNSKEFKGLTKIVQAIPAIFAKRICLPWLWVDFIFEFLYRTELNEMNNLWNQFSEWPLERAKTNYYNKKDNHLSPMPEEIDSYMAKGFTGGVNLIDIYEKICNTHPQFTESDMKTQMITLYFAGTEPVAITVASCVLVLGKHQDIQDRLYEEISSVVGPDEDVSTHLIGKMQYLDQVYKETLRWAAVIPYVQRRTTEELKLSDCTIPAGNSVVASLIGPNMDPSIYANPEKFDPEHFSPENTLSRVKNTFMPFSGGNRMCIAKTYSHHLVKTMLVHILRRYRVSTTMDPYNQKKSFALALTNSDKYHVQFTNR